MLVGVIADDFTGASDVAAMLARGGVQTQLMIGVPPDGRFEAEAAVVALKSRSIPAAEAVAQSLGVLDWLTRQGCSQILFKYCSTFDSTPAGNIGPVAEALAERLEVRGVVACPALPENGRTVYLGHLFVKGRLLNESGLERHPLNPMTDPDIRRWLARQSRGEVGLIEQSVVARGPEAVRSALEAADATLVIVDAISDQDLLTIGLAVIDAPLITGGSGVAMGLPANYRARGLLKGGTAAFPTSPGRGVVLSGSCAPSTRQQVDIFRADHPSFAIDIDALMAGVDVAGAARAFALGASDAAPLIFSSAEPPTVAEAQQRYGADALARAIEAMFARLAQTLAADGMTRIVVAGGETSGAVVSALGVSRFAIGPEIAPGVPALAAVDGPLRLALKSGNFGQPDFFARALDVLGGGKR